MKLTNLQAAIATRARQIAAGAIKQTAIDEDASSRIFESASTGRRLRRHPREPTSSQKQLRTSQSGRGKTVAKIPFEKTGP